jgi:catechol 2,3-dioxygenase-like lactoylglutathione lyase family enzyme
MGYRVGIVMLFCRDLAKSKAFYTETLGLAITPQMSSDTFILLDLPGGPPISLQPMGDLPAGVGAEPGAFTLGLLVDDVNATYQDLQDKGVELLTEVYDIGVGRSFRAKDPDGQVLEIYQFYPQFAEQPAQAEQPAE